MAAGEDEGIRAIIGASALEAPMGRHHYTNRGIRETGESGVSIPSVALLKAVDHAGLVDRQGL